MKLQSERPEQVTNGDLAFDQAHQNHQRYPNGEGKYPKPDAVGHDGSHYFKAAFHVPILFPVALNFQPQVQEVAA